jgi:hypothetical protein
MTGEVAALSSRFPYRELGDPKRFQVKRKPVHRPETPKNKEADRFRGSKKSESDPTRKADHASTPPPVQ